MCLGVTQRAGVDVLGAHETIALNKNSNVFLFLISVVFSHLMLFSKCILVIFELMGDLCHWHVFIAYFHYL